MKKILKAIAPLCVSGFTVGFSVGVIVFAWCYISLL